MTFHVLEISHRNYMYSISILNSHFLTGYGHTAIWEHILSMHLMSVQGYVQKSLRLIHWTSNTLWFWFLQEWRVLNSLHIICIGGPLALFLALVGWCYSGFYDKWWLQCCSFDRKGTLSFPSCWWVLYLLCYFYGIWT